MSLSSQVYDRLRMDLQQLEFGNNEFLNEAALAVRYQVSKAPIREALHQLCMEGVLVSYPRKGYLVAGVSQQELGHIRQLRWLNEGYVVETVARNATREALDRLLALAKQPYTVQGNTLFHNMLAELAESRALADVVARLLTTMERPLCIKNMSAQPPSCRNEHVRLAEALLNGNVDAAKVALHDDLAD